MKARTYVVTLRRDVQQKAVVHVEASSRQEAIDVARSAASAFEEKDWALDEYLGVHQPVVELPKLRRRA